MAKNVIGQVTGGDPKKFDDVETVGAVRSKMNVAAEYIGSINGAPAVDGDLVDDYDQVVFTQGSKAGL